MGFQRFTEARSGRGRPEGSDEMVSLRKSGSIGVNREALDEHFADKDGAVMYYDEDDNRIGIEPVDDPDDHDVAYTVTKTESGGTIAPQAFLDKYDLSPDITTQYDPDWDDDEGLIVIDVDDPKQTYGEED